MKIFFINKSHILYDLFHNFGTKYHHLKMKFNLKLHSIYTAIKDYNLFMLEENDYDDEPKDPVTIL